MGVHGLWDLIAPVGRRVSVETLAGKRLAIDASIWMIQFMKAMRDEKGEMVRNAHILGFFRRICKLLYLRTKPVFVFDGGTPALKRRTVIARRRQRDNAQAKIRKTAEKLLLSRVKEMRLKELADDLQKQRQENDIKGKRPISQESSVQNTEKENDNRHTNSSQEQLDEMLAASLAAEENEDFAFNASTSRPAIPDGISADGEEDEEDEEMILPEMHGKVDPAILAALPPSLQLDLLVQMRERLMAENRQKYQKVKKAPASFSEMQIQAYLKTVAFRREIDVVQKAAAGGGISGVQTSRIASEANREFIFSSSFTGDKQALTSVGRERVGSDQSQAPPLNIPTEPVNKDTDTRSSGSVAGSTDVETGREFPDDVETYRDDRGHLRVSKVRALGIRMTRDLQRNLDMMKEIEHRGVEVDLGKNSKSTTAGTLVDIQKNSCDRRQHPEITDNDDVEMIHEVEKRTELAASIPTSIEISFADVAERDELENDDDKLFACLVAGNPVIDFSFDNSTSRIQSSHSDSDVEWEEGSSIEKVTNTFKGGMSSQEKVAGEEGFQGIQKPFSCSDNIERTLTKGSLLEEADLQEAIRRSLMDKGGHESVDNFGIDNVSEGNQNMIIEHADSVFSYEGKEKPEVVASATTVCQPGGTENILETNHPKSNSSAFINLNPDKNNLELRILNQDGGTSRALNGQVSDTSDIQPGTKICSENSNDHTGSRQVETFDSEMTLNCLESGYSMSLNDSVHDRSVDSGFTEAQEKAHGASNNDSFDTTKLANISPDGIFTDADGLKEFIKDDIHGDSVVGKEGPLKNSFVDDLKEYEIMKDHLDEEMLFLGKEQEDLEIEQRKLERNAESVSSEMFVECQELLQMFGLPYIIAPMEAEAQCAFMEMSNLVDGVVTDDSDALLFGAQCVYKNIFDDRKYVETYLMKDIANELGLDREKLIHMALLLGSDYTEGVSGIGIVNAIEVVNAFPGKDGLREFRAWIESPDPSIFGNMDAKSRHNPKGKGFKGNENNTSGSKIEGNSCDQNATKPVDDTQRTKQVFMDKHRNVSKNWHIPANFPSDAVISAYDSPQVDKSTESFAWGKPDLHVLRKLCWEKFAWGTAKADELLLPVLKEYDKHETQLRLEAFYSFNERFAKIRSKRIKKAVKGMAGAKSSELMDEMRPQQAGNGQRRKPKQSEVGGVGSTELDGAGAGVPNDGMEQLTVKKSRARRAPQKNLETPVDVSGHPDPRKGVHVRGRQRGKGRGRLTGLGSRKMKSCSLNYKNEESSSERDQEMQSERMEESHLIRRSKRFRKTVSYEVSDESDNGDRVNENCPEVGLTAESFVNEEMGGVDATVDANEPTATGIDHGVGTRPIVDETENIHGTDTMSVSQIDDPFDQTESSKEYLQFGGGFCMEEDEQAKLDQHMLDPATREMITIPENHDIDLLEVAPGGSSGDTYVSDTVHHNTINTGSNDHTLDGDSLKHDGILLRAMPNLRKKRRT